MASLNFLKRIVIEDFDKKDQPLIAKIAYIFNPALEAITNALNHGMGITDLNVQLKQFDVTVDASGNPTQSTSFKSTLNGSCNGLIVIYAASQSTVLTYPTSAPFITFSQNQGVITIKHVSGLQPNTKYTLRVLAIV